MNHAAQVQSFSKPHSTLSLYTPPVPKANVAHWRINGHPAVVVVWTKEEWDRLENRPTDAQYYLCGVWCALRLT